MKKPSKKHPVVVEQTLKNMRMDDTESDTPRTAEEERDLQSSRIKSFGARGANMHSTHPTKN